MSVSDITTEEAQERIRQGDLQLLDVRTPGEYQGYGHIPGASLLPVDLVASAPGVLDPARPVLVICQHGIRSAHAAAFLDRSGFQSVLNMSGGMAMWSGPMEHGPPAAGEWSGPSSWLLAHAGRIRRGGDVLDVASGRGRHALLLASAGFRITAVDRDAGRLQALASTAARWEWPVKTKRMDLETGSTDLGDGLHDAVLVFRYLHRPLFPALIRSLRPEGLLLYETFTTAQAAQGHPKNPDFLLQPGELEALVQPCAIVARMEGESDGAQVAAVVAVRPGA